MRDELDVFGAERARQICFDRIIIHREITRVDVLNKLRSLWVGDVVDHHAAHALKSNESEGVAVDRGDLYGFGFRALVIRTVVSLVAVVASVKRASELLSRYPFEVATAVKDRAPGGEIPDSEGARSKGIEVLINTAGDRRFIRECDRLASGSQIPVWRPGLR